MSASTHSDDRLIGHLAAMPEGGRAPELAALMGVSQPTLSRQLRGLQARGLVVAEGSARSTRYHWVGARPSLADLRRRRLHEWVAHQLVDDPEIVSRARERLVKIESANPSGHRYHDLWRQLLDGPRPRLLRRMTEDSEEADQLRKESPFTGLIGREARRQIFERLGLLE